MFNDSMTQQSTVKPDLTSTQDFDEIMTDLRAPEAFDFNFEAYSECGVVSWRGPAASTSDQTINIGFEWSPSSGTTATLDAIEGAEYTVAQLRELHTALGIALAQLGKPSSESLNANGT